jgi:hypothetical protein
MPDIFVVVGDMTHSSETSKVALNYRPIVKKTMTAAVADAIKNASGFTTIPPDDGLGFRINLNLTEIKVGGVIQGRPAVTCNLVGSIASVPAGLLITKSLTGTATAGGSGTTITEGDVVYCITEAVKKTMVKSVLPHMKTLPKPQPPP